MTGVVLDLAKYETAAEFVEELMWKLDPILAKRETFYRAAFGSTSQRRHRQQTSTVSSLYSWIFGSSNNGSDDDGIGGGGGGDEGRVFRSMFFESVQQPPLHVCSAKQLKRLTNRILNDVTQELHRRKKKSRGTFPLLPVVCVKLPTPGKADELRSVAPGVYEELLLWCKEVVAMDLAQLVLFANAESVSVLKTLDVGKHQEHIVTRKNARQLKRTKTSVVEDGEEEDLELEMTSLEHALHERDKPLLWKVQQLLEKKNKRIQSELQRTNKERSGLETEVTEVRHRLQQLEEEMLKTREELQRTIERENTAKEEHELQMKTKITALERSQRIELRTAEKEVEKLKATVVELEHRVKRLTATKVVLEKQNQNMTKQLEVLLKDNEEKGKNGGGQHRDRGILSQVMTTVTPVGVAVIGIIGGATMVGIAVAAAIVMYNKKLNN
eukprot:TRINITY_DN5973_c0_g1_i1.p1 TRINITY_DN5973_c0_g1~~TRINITY_DN5973_c0_g1_i1.p1  ORF type:complete len:486 (-),score=162.37 TRINITY_DN5973_c0_g1_i1:24-1346(-)